jgi:hypothetical protein
MSIEKTFQKICKESVQRDSVSADEVIHILVCSDVKCHPALSTRSRRKLRLEVEKNTQEVRNVVESVLSLQSNNCLPDDVVEHLEQGLAHKNLFGYKVLEGCNDSIEDEIVQFSTQYGCGCFAECGCRRLYLWEFWAE